MDFPKYISAVEALCARYNEHNPTNFNHYVGVCHNANLSTFFISEEIMPILRYVRDNNLNFAMAVINLAEKALTSTTGYERNLLLAISTDTIDREVVRQEKDWQTKIGVRFANYHLSHPVHRETDTMYAINRAHKKSMSPAAAVSFLALAATFIKGETLDTLKICATQPR